MKENGVIYIVTGRRYFRSAIQSARSIRKYSPNLKVHVFTDEENTEFLSGYEEVISSFGQIKRPHYRSKVDYLSKTPFARTLYLDSDARICAPIDDIFDILDRFDIALAHAHRRYNPRTTSTWRESIPQSFPQFNGGVIAYKSSPKVLDLLESWSIAFHDAGFEKDQVTLRELLWKSDLRIATLPPEYNLRFKKYLKIWEGDEAQPKILHFKEFHEEVSGVLKFLSLDKIKQIFNLLGHK
jgi:lipopolysaccharide biosynthesis glycosyltransferase